MKIKILILLSIITLSCFAQNTDSLKHCGADEMRLKLLQSDEKLKKAILKREEALNSFTKDFQKQSLNKSRQSSYVIPVVFHVIHNYGTENISDAQILDGLRVLNNYFNKNSSDSTQIISAFKPLVADCEIEFRLAQKDPSGNCTKGINRIASSLTSVGDHQVKQLIHWPPHQYLNIYIVANAAGLAGHCIWPTDADTIPQWDGIVIGHNYVGSIGTSTPTTQVTLSHEVGHFFNLHHTWGGNNVPGYYFLPCANPNKDCNIDDEVADTPTTIGWQTCNLNGASCGSTLDNVQNMMEYSYCNRMFTPGQKARMHACLNDTIANRNNLWSQNNLQATGTDGNGSYLCAADFYYTNTNICNGKTVTYTNASYNGTIDSVKWYFQGGMPLQSSLQSVVVTYNSPGLYNVKLVAYANGDSVIKQINELVFVTNANAPAGVMFNEDFEDFTNLRDSSFAVLNSDSLVKWEITNIASSNGLQSLWLDNFNNAPKNKDEIISPTINLSGQNGAGIFFKYAFAQKSSLNNDKLALLISKDCGATWVQRWSKQGINLKTTDSSLQAYTPSQQDWTEVIVTNLPSYFYTDGFKFKFVFESDGGNNIFIDDVNVNFTTSAQQISLSEFKIYPQPASDQLLIENEFPFTYEMYNSLGQFIEKSETMNLKHQINCLNKSKGIYFVKLKIGDNYKVQRIAIE